jgi:hypothetical protein
MRKLRVTRSAVADLDEIWLYIARNGSVEAAERVVDLIPASSPCSPPCRALAAAVQNWGLRFEAFPCKTTGSIIDKRRAVSFGFCMYGTLSGKNQSFQDKRRKRRRQQFRKIADR